MTTSSVVDRLNALAKPQNSLGLLEEVAQAHGVDEEWVAGSVQSWARGVVQGWGWAAGARGAGQLMMCDI